METPAIHTVRYDRWVDGCSTGRLALLAGTTYWLVEQLQIEYILEPRLDPASDTQRAYGVVRLLVPFPENLEKFLKTLIDNNEITGFYLLPERLSARGIDAPDADLRDGAKFSETPPSPEDLGIQELVSFACCQLEKQHPFEHVFQPPPASGQPEHAMSGVALALIMDAPLTAWRQLGAAQLH